MLTVIIADSGVSQSVIPFESGKLCRAQLSALHPKAEVKDNGNTRKTTGIFKASVYAYCIKTGKEE